MRAPCGHYIEAESSSSGKTCYVVQCPGRVMVDSGLALDEENLAH